VPRYNRSVLRHGILLGTLVLAACHSRIQEREQVEADLMQYLHDRTGLDLNALDVDVTKVLFENDQARATVSFHQKGDTSIGNSMLMIYTLSPRNGHWVVTGRSDSQGHGLGGTPNTQQDLPPGHPPVAQQLPAGHPPLDQGAVKPEKEAQGQPK
jgi:hypothetical protein